MNVTRRPHSNLSLATVFGLVMGVSAPMAIGQDALDDDEVFDLNPFVIEVGTSVGYMNQNTLSGTRLRGSLRDTSAAVSVFTQEFLEDIGATSLDDVANYSLNTDRQAGIVAGDIANGNAFRTGDTTFRIRGLPSSGRMINFFSRSLEVDTFNTQQIEGARGPNAVLFGLGQPGGVFNVSTKKAILNRPLYELSFRFGSWNQRRGTVDLNQPLIDDKLAVRVNLAKSSMDGARPHEYRKEERAHLALQYRPHKNTILHVEYEYGDISRNTPRPWLGFDNFTYWMERGSPLDTNPTSIIGRPDGTKSVEGRFTYYNDLGIFVDQQGRTESRYYDGSAGLGPFANVTATHEVMITDFSVVPRDAVLGGPGLGTDTRLDIFNATLQQRVFDDLFIEAALYYQDSSVKGRDWANRGIRVRWDTNAYLPTGDPNPYAGQPYVEGDYFLRDRYEDILDYRVTGTYSFNLGDWLGRHNIAAMAQRRVEKVQTDQFLEWNISSPLNTNFPNAGPNRVRRRSYVNLDGPVAQIALADFRPQFTMENASILNREGLTENAVSTAWINHAPAHSRFDVDTLLAIWQGFFFNDRVVTSFGYRKDKTKSYSFERFREPGFGPFAEGGLFSVLDSDYEDDSGITRNFGVVYHALNWLSFNYNRAYSFALRNRNHTVFPNDSAPNPKGEGEDFGIKLNLLDNRLFLTALYYETSATNDSANFNPGLYSGGVNLILEALDGVGQLGQPLEQAEVSTNAFLLDAASRGVEFELVANPLPNWRVIANYSRTKSVGSNIASEYYQFMDANKPLWTQGDNALLVVNRDPELDPIYAASAYDDPDHRTVAEVIRDIENDAFDRFAKAEGVYILGRPQSAGSLRTNYTFRDGKLDGFSMGMGARYRGRTPIGYTTDDPATREAYWDGSKVLWDMNMGYQREVNWFGRRANWSVQLNVRNLFDNDDLILTAVQEDGHVRTYRFDPPREVFVTTRIRF